jgi:hypothetical protein
VKFRSNEPGPVYLPALGIGHLEPGEEFEVTGEPAAQLEKEGRFPRTDGPKNKPKDGE